jgi:hypothetical protein
VARCCFGWLRCSLLSAASRDPSAGFRPDDLGLLGMIFLAAV